MGRVGFPPVIYAAYGALHARIAMASELGGVVSDEPPGRDITNEQALMLVVNALFLLVGMVYGSRVLAPKPMTYLSEIAFPLDFCGKMVACTLLFLLYALQWMYEAIICAWVLQHHAFGQDPQGVIAMMETLVWGMSSGILWMEYRRGLTPSAYLRVFWLVKWLDTTYFLVTKHQFVTSPAEDNASHTSAMVLGGLGYAASSLLVVSLFLTPTPVTPECVSYPPEVNTPTAYLYSSQRRPPTSLYGSFRELDLSIKGSDPREALEVTIPSATASIWGNKSFVSFKIVVQTDDDRWTLRRPYSDFAALHEELPEEVRADCPLPRDDPENRKFLSWKGRPRSLKSRLETYLKQVLSHPKFDSNTSLGLCEFLEMEYVEDPTIRSYHSVPRI